MPKKNEDIEYVQEALASFADYVDEERTNLSTGTWVKGQSGNPSGRPAIPEGLTLDEMLLFKLNKTRMASLATVLINKAIDDQDLKAIIYLCDRVAGKPRQQTIETVEQDDPLVLILKDLHDDEEKPDKRKLDRKAEPRGLPEGEVREGTSEEA